MVKSLSLISILVVLVVSSASAQSQPPPFLFDRQIVSKPKVQAPAEAVASGLGGVVRVVVEVDAQGNVVSVGSSGGPDAVCPLVNRADVAAMRSRALEAAKSVKFAPVAEGGPLLSRSSVEFFFPGKETRSTESVVKGEKNYNAAGSSADYVGPVNTVNESKASEKKDDNRYTVKGDINYSAASSPPSDPPASGGGVGKRLSGGVLNGKAALLPRPPYPPAARAVRASGAVSIQVLVDEEGRIFSAQAVSGHPLLRPAAVTAACKAEFTPTFLEGNPVKVSGIITYNFAP